MAYATVAIGNPGVAADAIHGAASVRDDVAPTVPRRVPLRLRRREHGGDGLVADVEAFEPGLAPALPRRSPVDHRAARGGRRDAELRRARRRGSPPTPVTVTVMSWSTVVWVSLPHVS